VTHVFSDRVLLPVIAIPEATFNLKSEPEKWQWLTHIVEVVQYTSITLDCSPPKSHGLLVQMPLYVPGFQ
jgi:hypothetical protein